MGKVDTGSESDGRLERFVRRSRDKSKIAEQESEGNPYIWKDSEILTLEKWLGETLKESREGYYEYALY